MSETTSKGMNGFFKKLNEWAQVLDYDPVQDQQQLNKVLWDEIKELKQRLELLESREVERVLDRQLQVASTIHS